MEDGQRKPDVSKVAVAVLQGLVAGGALARLARGAELVIEGSILVRSTVVFNVVEQSVRDFGHGLVGDVLVGPGEQSVSDSYKMWSEGRAILDAKLDAAKALGHLVNKLLLDTGIVNVGHAAERSEQQFRGLSHAAANVRDSARGAAHDKLLVFKNCRRKK